MLHLKDMHHELELLTKELRQVNLQQFIKQTGTKVTVLPAEPSEEEGSNSSQSKGNFTFVHNILPSFITLDGHSFYIV